MRKENSRFIRGFTLIELLAVIVVLGLIGLITIPVVNKILKDSKIQLYQEQIRLLEENAKKWGTKNDDMLPREGNVLALSFQDIQKEGLLEKGEIKDPRNGEQLKGCIYVQYDNEYNQYLYDYKEECDPSMGLWKAPVITVNGKTINQTITLTVMEHYTIPEGTAVDYEGNPVEVITEGNISPDVPGKYQIVYKATDKKGVTGTLVLTVNIIDTSKPTVDYVINNVLNNGWYNSNVVVTLSGTNRGSNPSSYEYQINTGTGYSNWNIVSGNSFTITTEGSNISFKVRSKSKNSVYSDTKESPIIKIDKTKPVVKTITLDPKEATTGPITITVEGTDHLSGIQAYSFDEGLTWQLENKKVFHENQTIKVMVKDKAGNVSISNTSSQIIIDKIETVKPTIEYQVVGTPFNSNGWASENFYINIVSHVGQSGMKTAQYCISSNGDNCTPTTTISSVDSQAVQITSESANNKICSVIVDNANQSSGVICSNPYKLDKSTPNIVAKASSYTIVQGDSANPTTYFNITYGISGGTTTCNIANTSSLAVGTATITCESTGLNGKSMQAQTNVIVKSKVSNIDDIIEEGLKTGELEQIGDDYRFVGSDVSNSLKFDGVTGNSSEWQIISINKDPNSNSYYVKAIDKTRIQDMAWDSSTANGVNNWKRPSTLNTYLNGIYYNSVLDTKIKKYMISKDFNVGSISEVAGSIEEVVSQETATIQSGKKVGLMNVSDYVYACADKKYRSTQLRFVNCKGQNWLYSYYWIWTINASSDKQMGSTTAPYVFLIAQDGYASGNTHPSQTNGIRPVIFLSSDMKITAGDGSYDNPYIVQ